MMIPTSSAKSDPAAVHLNEDESFEDAALRYKGAAEFWKAQHDDIAALASLPEATAQAPALSDTKDAKRYRWLRSIDSSSEWNRVGHFAEGALDAAIDAAIATPEAPALSDSDLAHFGVALKVTDKAWVTTCPYCLKTLHLVEKGDNHEPKPEPGGDGLP